MEVSDHHPLLKIFGLGSSRVLAASVAECLGLELEPLDEEIFPDGEGKVRPLNSVTGKDVVLFQSMSNEPGKSPDQKITEMLILLSLCKDYGVRSVTAILPYFSYSRSDQRKDFQDPLVLKYLAHLYEAAGLQRILTLDVHNIAAFENAFHCLCLNLEAAPIFCEHVKQMHLSGPVVVMSPDLGGLKRAEKFRKILEISLGQPVSSVFLEKYREKEGLFGSTSLSSVKGSNVLIYDDMISTGKTVLRAAQALHQAEARSVTVLATHGLFSEKKDELLNSDLVDQFIVTDSNPMLASPVFGNFSKLRIISCAKILAEGLRQ
ncbi:MAG: ribose-phosphate diphosphokinase [Bacillota bacterium]